MFGSWSVQNQEYRSIANQLAAIDSAVNMAGRNNVYIGLMQSVSPGSYDLAQLKAFWAVVAPRYKDRTHVLYEMVNEPVAWWPESYTAQNIADLKSVLDTIRKTATNTIVELFDFPNMNSSPIAISTISKMTGVDWTKAAVAFHWYSANEPSVAAVKTQYPVIMTEVDNTGNGGSQDSLVMISCEKLKVSWVYLLGKSSSQLDIMAARIAAVNRMGYAWQMDNLSSAVLPRSSTKLFVRLNESGSATLYNMHGQRIRSSASGIVIDVPKELGARPVRRAVVDKRY